MQRTRVLLLAVAAVAAVLSPARAADPPPAKQRLLDYLSVGSHVTMNLAGSGSSYRLRILLPEQVEQNKEAAAEFAEKSAPLRAELERVRKARQEKPQDPADRNFAGPNSEESRLLQELGRLRPPPTAYRVIAVGADFVELQSAFAAPEDERGMALAASHIAAIDLPRKYPQPGPAEGRFSRRPPR